MEGKLRGEWRVGRRGTCCQYWGNIGYRKMFGAVYVDENDATAVLVMNLPEEARRYPHSGKLELRVSTVLEARRLVETIADSVWKITNVRTREGRGRLK